MISGYNRMVPMNYFFFINKNTTKHNVYSYNKVMIYMLYYY